MKNLKKWIIILLLIVLIILIIRQVIIKYYDNKYIDGLGPDSDYSIKSYNPISEKNASVFYTVEDCVQRYVDYVVQLRATNEGQEEVLKLLDNDYKNNNKITVDNVIDSTLSIDTSHKFTTLKMEYITYDNDLQVYRVYGKLNKEDTGELYKYCYFKVTLDLNNSTFSIEPVNNCNNLNDIVLEEYEIDKQIEDNLYNSFSYFDVNDDVLVNNYVEYIKNALLNTPEEIYNILDNDYKNKNFSSLQEFKIFIEKNKDIIENYSIKSIDVQDMIVDQIFTCIDNNQRKYIINQQAIMDFSLIMEF